MKDRQTECLRLITVSDINDGASENNDIFNMIIKIITNSTDKETQELNESYCSQI